MGFIGFPKIRGTFLQLQSYGLQCLGAYIIVAFPDLLDFPFS